MCCFSVSIAPRRWWQRLRGRTADNAVHVARTRILARRIDPKTQALVYQMDFGSKGDVAMILPLPVAADAIDGGVHFIDLSGWADLFTRLDALFPRPEAGVRKNLARAAGPMQSLPVLRVGSFEASVVPSPAEFVRLDSRFRMPPSFFAALPAYRDYAFAVFKLAPGLEQRVHPMALRFATRDPLRLFFPTVHVHDGRVHRRAAFDHALYWQVADKPAAAEQVADPPTHAQLGGVDGRWPPGDVLSTNEWLVRCELRGSLPNIDTWIDREGRAFA